MSDPCPFCPVPTDRVAFATAEVIAFWDAFPVSPGHLLVIPRRHIPSWWDATHEERAALLSALNQARGLITERHHADAFNIGINVGAAAGQTVFHLHIHVIPRYTGDVPDPRGGVRHVIPGKANYLATASLPGLPSRLVEGGKDDPLFPELVEQLAKAQEADVAVGFVLPSGMDRLQPHFQDLLARGGRLRLLTGDYLGITDPSALMRLLDLEGARELRVFVTAQEAAPPVTTTVSFHPKSYLFRRADGTGIAYVGSSNLSDSALVTGIEWNYRAVSSADTGAYANALAAFDRLFNSVPTVPLTTQWVDAYRARRPVMLLRPAAVVEVPVETTPPPEPHEIQREALTALAHTRTECYKAGLVVMATGLGKTWLAAFDTHRPEYRRVLFVAHREEILSQAMKTFRRIRPEAHLGHYRGQLREVDADILFASVQTLGRAQHLERFSPTAFDYIVVDEFHHASAPTYRRLIDYFQPQFLLGLTATPERTDGGDLWALCEENLVYRCDLLEGMRRGLLARFEYFGVPDEVDYANIPWRSARFDEEELTARLATEARAQNALDQLDKRGGERALAFCVSQRHADFMAGFLNAHGRRAVAVHAGETSAPRAASLELLAAGQLDVICAVDVFNEGLDLPDLDTILMLRPTESRIVWLQQFGRGLRKTDEHKVLKVIDYIGNHRAFLLKPQTLFDLGTQHAEILALLERATQEGRIEVAPGCFVTYDLQAIDLLRGLLKVTENPEQALRRFYEDFRERHGVRPTATEAFHEGYNPRAQRRRGSDWFALVREMGDLSDAQVQAAQQNHHFLSALETTEMVRSYKMLVLLAMLNRDAFPGEIAIADLATSVAEVAARNPHLTAELGSHENLSTMLERNPIAAWTGGRGTGEVPYFSYSDGLFRSSVPAGDSARGPLQELTRELAAWRLAEYLQRSQTRAAHTLVCRVSQANGRPLLFLPNRTQHPELPDGPTPVTCNDAPYEAVFAKVAINVVRRSAEEPNQLPTILRGWFGPDAGQPGTRHEVALEPGDSTWTLRPIGRSTGKAELWRAYSREQIPSLFGLEFSQAIWNMGFVFRGNQIFLLVTLDKSSKTEDFKYKDHFLSPTLLQWESQNRTTQASSHGQAIQNHELRGIPVHLFVRRASKQGTRSAPFVYCGDVRFRDWEGEAPITVGWELPEGLPARLRELLGNPALDG